MSVFGWVLDFYRRAQADGDVQRQMLLEIARVAGGDLRGDPGRALTIYEQGRQLAESLAEPWWVMYFTHWKLQVLLNFRPNFHEAQRLAVQATLEVRKPIYEGLPQRVCLHDDLVNSHIGSDAVGYADAIRDALTFMQADVAPGMECRYCIQSDMADFALALKHLDEAEGACRRILDMADGESSASTRAHHSMTAESRFCEIAYLRGDWQALREHALAGEALFAEVNRSEVLAELLMWQALCARHERNTSAAARLLRRAQTAVARSGAVPRSSYHDAWAAYHLEAEEVEAALGVREEEQKLIAGKGMTQREAHCWLERCRLLARLGRPLDEAKQEARTAIGRLRRPDAMLAELAQIQG